MVVEEKTRDLSRFLSTNSLWSFMLLEVSGVCWNNLAHRKDSGNSSQNTALCIAIDISVKMFAKLNWDTFP